MLGPGWNESVFTFYGLAGATKLRETLARFDGHSNCFVDNPVMLL